MGDKISISMLGRATSVRIKDCCRVRGAEDYMCVASCTTCSE